MPDNKRKSEEGGAGEYTPEELNNMLAVASAMSSAQANLGKVDIQKILAMLLFSSVPRSSAPTLTGNLNAGPQSEQKAANDRRQLLKEFISNSNTALEKNLREFWRVVAKQQKISIDELMRALKTSLAQCFVQEQTVTTMIDFKSLPIDKLVAALNKVFENLIFSEKMTLADGSSVENYTTFKFKQDNENDSRFVIDATVTTNAHYSVKDGKVQLVADTKFTPIKCELSAVRQENGHLLLDIGEKMLAELHDLIAPVEHSLSSILNEFEEFLHISHAPEAPVASVGSEKSAIAQPKVKATVAKENVEQQDTKWSKFLNVLNGVKTAVHHFTEAHHALAPQGQTVSHGANLNACMDLLKKAKVKSSATTQGLSNDSLATNALAISFTDTVSSAHKAAKSGPSSENKPGFG